MAALTSTLSMSTTPAQAVPFTTIYLDPSEITFNVTDVSVGHRFNVTAMVSNVSDLMVFQVALYYNASVINMTSASVPADHVLAGQNGMSPPPAYDYFDSWGVGSVSFTAFAGETPFSGDGKLVVFEFEIIAAPEAGNLTSPLIISYKPSGGVYESKLRDSTGTPIEFTAEDGDYEYVLLPDIYLDPSEIEFDIIDVSVGDRFNVTAMISNVSDLMLFQVALYYNASVINMTNAWLPTWNSSYVFYGQNDTAIGPSYTYFDSWGCGLIGFNGSTGTTTPFTGSGMLTVFEFEIIAAPEAGNLTSPLIISYKVSGGTYESKLRDSTAGAISFVGTDGSYIIIPEFLSLLILPMFLILTLVALVLTKKLQRKRGSEDKG